jgi:hypothetical protein
VNGYSADHLVRKERGNRVPVIPREILAPHRVVEKIRQGIGGRHLISPD